MPANSYPQADGCIYCGTKNFKRFTQFDHELRLCQHPAAEYAREGKTFHSVAVLGTTEKGYNTYPFLDALDWRYCIDHLYETGGSGVAHDAWEWARMRGVEITTIRPPWKEFGLTARRRQVAKIIRQNPDFIVVFASKDVFHERITRIGQAMPNTQVIDLREAGKTPIWSDEYLSSKGR